MTYTPSTLSPHRLLIAHQTSILTTFPLPIIPPDLDSTLLSHNSTIHQETEICVRFSEKGKSIRHHGGVTAGLVRVLSPSGKYIPLLENIEVDQKAPFYTHFFYLPEEAGEHCLSVWGRDGCLAEMKVDISEKDLSSCKAAYLDTCLNLSLSLTGEDTTLPSPSPLSLASEPLSSSHPPPPPLSVEVVDPLSSSLPLEGSSDAPTRFVPVAAGLHRVKVLCEGKELLVLVVRVSESQKRLSSVLVCSSAEVKYFLKDETIFYF